MMKTKDNKVLYSVITAIVIVVISAFIFGLIFGNNKNDIYITLYSPIGNTKQVIKTSSGSEIDNIPEPVDVEGYEFIGWFYDDDLTLKVEKGTVFNSSRVLKAGYSKIIEKSMSKDINYNDITNQKFLTVKTYGVSITSIELKTILNKGVRYLNLSNADFENSFIDNEIFFGNSSLKELIIPRNVNKIENNAFKNCYNLKYIKLSDQTKTLRNNVFYNCKSLSQIDNLESVEVLGQSVFEGCESLKTLNLGKDLRTIENKCFYGISLEKLSIDSQNQSFRIYGNVLYSRDFVNLIYVPTNYSGSLMINENTQKVCDFALVNCKFLSSVTFPSSLTYIGDSAFKDCKRLEYVNFNTAKNYVLSNNSFSGCVNLKQINFSLGLESIGRESFKDCKSLKTVVFNISTASNISNINSIGNGAFKNCKNLEYIVIPDSVLFIGNELFSGCSKLEEVKLSSKIETIPEKMFYENTSLTKVVANGNIKSVANYAFAECLNLSYIESLYTAQNLGVGAFKNCKSIKTALFNDANIIADDCFMNCCSLVNVSFDNVITYGSRVFENCISLTNFVISSKTQQIESDTFNYCQKIESYTCVGNTNYISVDGVLYDIAQKYIMAYPQNKKYVNFTIKSSVEEIKDKGLYLNQYLKNIDVQSGNTRYSSVDGILFNYDKSVLLRYPCGKETRDIVIYYNIQTVAEYAFAFNKNIERLELPISTTTIEKNALYGVDNIKTLIVPFIGKNINEDKFIGYVFGASSYVANHNFVPESLKNVVVTNDIQVAEYSFYDATSIEYIEFNKDVSIINKYAFYGASSLKEIFFNGQINSIKTNAIYKLANLKKLTFGFDSLLIVDNNAVGELTYKLEVYIHNKNQNVSQDFRSLLISKFSSIYSRAGDWQWQFKNNVKNIL